MDVIAGIVLTIVLTAVICWAVLEDTIRTIRK